MSPPRVRFHPPAAAGGQSRSASAAAALGGARVDPPEQGTVAPAGRGARPSGVRRHARALLDEENDRLRLLRPSHPRPPRAPQRTATEFPSDMALFEQAALEPVLTPRHGLVLPSSWQRLAAATQPMRQMALNAGGALVAGGMAAVGGPAQVAAVSAAASPYAPTGILAALAGAGGWAALACMALVTGGALFGAAYGASHNEAAPAGASSFRLAAGIWPGIAFGVTLVASRALAVACPLPIACVGLLAASACIAYGGRWLEAGRKPRLNEVVTASVVGSVAVSLAFGLGRGLAPDIALAQAAITGTCSALVGVAGMMGLSLGPRFIPTFFVDNLRVRQSALEEHCFAPGLSRPGPDGQSLPQTIFQMPEGVEQFTRECQAALGPAGEPFRGFNGLPVLHLHGPPGGGKTMGSRGIAQALGAEYVYLANADLKADAVDGVPVGGFNAWAALLQSEQLGRRLQKPVVLMLDEINHILPSLSAPYSDEKFYQAVGFVQLVQTMHLHARTMSFVALVTATNFPEEIAPFTRLMSVRKSVFVDKPSAASQRDILIAGQQNIERRMDRSGAGSLPLDESLLGKLLAQSDARGGISGRSLGKLLEWGKWRVYYNAKQGPQAPEERVRALYAAMHSALARMPTPPGKKNKRPRPHPKPSPRPSPSPSPSSAGPSTPASGRNGASEGRRTSKGDDPTARAREAEDVLQRCHLRDIPAAQVLEELVRSLTAAYLDPSNNLALARLKARLGITSLLYAQLYARAVLGNRPTEPFHDVLDASTLHVFASAEGPGAVGQMAGALQASLTLNARAAWRGANSLLKASGIDMEAPLGGLRGGMAQMASAARSHLRR